jgi:hypothetical protein
MRLAPLLIFLLLVGCDSGEPEPSPFGAFEASVTRDGEAEAWSGRATYAFFGSPDGEMQFILTMIRGSGVSMQSMSVGLDVAEAELPAPGTYGVGEPDEASPRAFFTLLDLQGGSPAVADDGQFVVTASDAGVVSGSFEVTGREGFSGDGPPFSASGSFEAVRL